MNARTISRFALGALLLGAYYLAPLFVRDGAGIPGIHPDRIRAIELAVPGDEGFRVQRTRSGWQFEGRRNIRADATQVDSFLEGLGGARIEKSAAPEDVNWAILPELRLTPRRGRDTVLELGPRVRPFRSQLIRHNGQVYEIAADLSASLGLWIGEFAWDAGRILDRIPLLVHGDDIVRIRLGNLFADYTFERTGEIVAQEENQYGEIERHYRWLAGGAHEGRTPSPAAMYRFARHLRMLVVDAVEGEPMPETDPARTVSYTTETGEILELATGKPLSGDTRRRLWLRQPYPSDAFLVDDRFFHRFTPAGAALFEDRPVFATGTSTAVRIAYEREGRRLVLAREPGRAWRIAQPQIPYSIYTPPPEPGTPSQSMAEIYAAGIDTIRSDEIFVPDTEERRQLVAGVFDQPAVRLILEARSGDRSEILLSEPVAGTGRVFVSYDGEIGVLHERFLQSLAPDVTYFLNPAEIEGRTIEW